MTLNQVTKRLEKLTIQIDSIRGRLETLTKDMAQEKPAKAAKANGATKSSGGTKRSAIGRSIVYGGVKGKIVERKGNKFVAEMADGKRKHVSTTYVYRQLNGDAKPAPEKAEPQEQPTQAAQVAPAPQPAQDQPAAPVESKVA